MKRLVLLIVVLLLAVPAFAQVAFQVTSLPRQVRGEGQTETVGEIFLSATGTPGTIKAGSTINIIYSAPVTVTAGNSTITAQNFAPVIGPGGITTAVAGNQLTISFAADVAFALGNGLTIAQVRVDASGAANGGFITANISGVSTLPATNPITFTQPTVTVGIVNRPSATVTASTSAGNTGAAILTCTASVGNFRFTIKEGYPAVFTTAAQEQAFTPNIVTTNGSQYEVIVSGAPKGVILTPTINAGTTATVAATVTPATKTIATADVGKDQTFTFAFTGTDLSAIESLVVDMGMSTGSAITPIGAPATVTMRIRTAPVDTASPQTKIARFVDSTLATFTLGTVSDCATTLLFPYVAANVAGFDTSVSISNTTLDSGIFPTGVGATAQGGTCTLVGVPTPDPSAPGTLGTSVTLTTPSIASGGTWSASLGSTTAFSGFIGYAFATCNFLNAHGFAFINNGFPGVPTIAMGYLPLVVPRVGTRVIPAGETLGQ